jgi:uncharacterized protein YjfI (DUF2170 family)
MFKFDTERKMYPKGLLGISQIKERIYFVMLHSIAVEENLFDMMFDKRTDFHTASKMNSAVEPERRRGGCIG